MNLNKILASFNIADVQYGNASISPSTRYCVSHLSLRLQQGLASHEMRSSYSMDKAHLIHRSCKRI